MELALRRPGEVLHQVDTKEFDALDDLQKQMCVKVLSQPGLGNLRSLWLEDVQSPFFPNSLD